MEEFIYNLQLSPGLKPSSFKEIHFDILSNIIKALILILPSIYFLNKLILRSGISSNFIQYQDKMIDENNISELVNELQNVTKVI